VLGAIAQSRHHPTLVAYGDVETTPYLVMEYIDGVRLDDWLGHAPMAPEDITRVGTAMALALSDLHRQDVVHLDLKPTNVLFRPNGEAVLIDFGLARHGHFPDLLAEELRIPLGNWVLHGSRADPRGALRSAVRHLCAGRHPVRARDGTPPFGHPASVAELRRRFYRDPIPPTRARALDAAMAAGDRPALSRSGRSRPYASAATLRSRCPRRPRSRSPSEGSRPAPRRPADDRAPAAPGRAIRTRALPAALHAAAVDACGRRRDLAAGSNVALRDALLDAARAAIAADPGCRIACITVVPSSGESFGRGEESSATGRHIKRLIELRGWAKPLELPEERVTYHVLESDKAGRGACRLREDERCGAHPDRRPGRRHASVAVCKRRDAGRRQRPLHRHGGSHARGRLKLRATNEGGSMSDFESKGQRFVALCLLGVLLFNYPVLALFNVSGTVLGVPILYVYMFVAWSALIALMAWLAESGR
jgi:serine/threonine protein kinase